MGKYLRKCCRADGEAAVLEVQQVVGVRTRAKTLAMATAEAKGSSCDKRRKVENGEFQISYLQLRSRTLFMVMSNPKTSSPSTTTPPAGEQEEANSRAGDLVQEHVSSRCSSNASSSEVSVAAAEKVEVGVEGLESASCHLDRNSGGEGEDERSSREATPLSDLRCHDSDELESTARPAAGADSGRAAKTSPSPSTMPSEVEIEEFFAAAESEAREQFSERYNYDVVKDMPMEGRYEWVRLKP